MVREYVGARYVSKFSDVNNGVWDNSYSYEALTIVKYGNDFYTSKIPVPVGADINDDQYWVLTGNYNGAIAALDARLHTLEDEKIIFTPEEYGAAGDGVNDDTTAFQDAINAALLAHGMVIASRVYAITGSLKISNTVSLPGVNEKPFMIFNKIIYSGADSALYLCGRDIRIIGGCIHSSKHGLSLGDGTKGLQNSYIEISLIDSTESAIVTAPAANENVQYINISNAVIYYGRHGIDFDLTTRYIGEIHINNCLFSRKSTSLIVGAAIYGHNFSHTITGLYLSDVSFEGVPDQNCLEFDSVIGTRPIFPLQLENIRYDEVSSNTGKLIKFTGSGSPLPSVYAEISVDVINLDSIDITNVSDAYVHVTAGHINNSEAHEAIYSPTASKLLVIPNEYEGIATSGILTKLPDVKIIRLIADTTVDLIADFIGEKLLIAAGNTVDLTFNTPGGPLAYSMPSNSMIRIYCSHIQGVGMRIIIGDIENITLRLPNV